jgi:hypothetical protein
MLIDRLEALMEQYNNVYTYDKVVVRNTFRFLPNLVQYTEDVHHIKQEEDLRQKFEQSKLLAEIKATINQLQETTEKFAAVQPQVDQLVKELTEAHDKALDNMITDFRGKLSQLELFIRAGLRKELTADEKAVFLDQFLKVINTDTINSNEVKLLTRSLESMQNYFIKAIIKALIKTLKDNMDLEFHA